MGYLLSSGDLPMHQNNTNLNKTFTFRFKWELQLTCFVSWLAAHLYFLWLCFDSFLLCMLFCPLLWCNCCIRVTVLLYQCLLERYVTTDLQQVSCWCGTFRKRNGHISQSLYIKNRPPVKLRPVGLQTTWLIATSLYIYITTPFHIYISNFNTRHTYKLPFKKT